MLTETISLTLDVHLRLRGRRKLALFDDSDRDSTHCGCEYGDRSGAARLSGLGNSSYRAPWCRRCRCCGALNRLARSRKVSPTPRERISEIGRLRSTRSAQDEYNSDASGSRRGNCSPDLGRAHGPDRDHTRLRPATPTHAELRARHSVQSLPRRLGRNVNPPEQHGYRTNGHGVRGRRTRRPRAGAFCDARRQCRHDAHRPGAVVRCLAGFIPAHPHRRIDVPSAG